MPHFEHHTCAKRQRFFHYDFNLNCYKLTAFEWTFTKYWSFYYIRSGKRAALNFHNYSVAFFLFQDNLLILASSLLGLPESNVYAELRMELFLFGD